jgi:hypothetical protein
MKHEITDELEAAALTAALADANEAQANVAHLERQRQDWIAKRDATKGRLERLTARIALGKGGLDSSKARATAARLSDGSIRIEITDEDEKKD